jgi:hypothetical protein
VEESQEEQILNYYPGAQEDKDGIYHHREEKTTRINYLDTVMEMQRRQDHNLLANVNLPASQVCHSLNQRSLSHLCESTVERIHVI